LFYPDPDAADLFAISTTLTFKFHSKLSVIFARWLLIIYKSLSIIQPGSKISMNMTRGVFLLQVLANLLL